VKGISPNQDLNIHGIDASESKSTLFFASEE